jgi:tagatose 6-phosphate kinase
VILTVTPNAALDITYEVDELVVHQSHRVTAVRQRAGGKGVNVASVLARMGHPVIATGLVGGAAGDEIRADLEARGVVARFVDGGGSSRRTVNVVSAVHGDATIFNEPGPELTGPGWQSLVAGLDSLLGESAATVVVLSGSLPPGLPDDDAYAELVDLGHAHKARVIVDADGAALRGALRSEPDLIVPNRAELAGATGIRDVAAGVTALRELGARDVLVSSGADGLVLVPEDGPGWYARLTVPLSGNPTGAGDALVAALASGLAAGSSWHQMMQDAVIWSAAAVLQPIAGEIDPDDVARLASQVVMEAR